MSCGAGNGPAKVRMVLLGWLGELACGVDDELLLLPPHPLSRDKAVTITSAVMKFRIVALTVQWRGARLLAWPRRVFGKPRKYFPLCEDLHGECGYAGC